MKTEKLFSQSQQERTQQMKAEQLFTFERGGQRGRWLKISDENDNSLEGSHFVPEKNSNGEVVIFHPGLPGDGAAWFEEKDLPTLLEEGYEVFVARHRGLLSSENNKTYFHNEERRKMAEHETAQAVSVGDWLTEPEISLRYFSKKPITLITHSFGALTAGRSLVNLQERYGDSKENPASALKKWLILGGVTQDLKEGGVTDISKGITLETWKGFFEWLNSTGIYKTKGFEHAAEDFEKELKIFNEKIADLSANVQVVSVVTEHDPYIGLEAGTDLQAHLKRGLVVNDTTFDKNLFPEGVNPHDFPHMAPETMVRLIQMKISQFPHVATVSDKNVSGR